MHPHKMIPTALYVHIPFCAQRCHYCDFNTYTLEGQPVEAYLDALERELELTVAAVPPGELETIFIGGGTPTALTAAQMERLLAMLAKWFPRRAADLEFTVEANPGTSDDGKFEVMYAAGVNRLSFGAQTFRDDLLQAIGRIHDAAAVDRSVATAKAVGFTNVSVDLMFGLPNQTLDDVEKALERAFALDLHHYSIYGLKVEERTLFHAMQQRGELALPAEEVEAAMFELIMARLREHGYEQYEISNFARPGYAGRHNKQYWHNRPYYAVGAGAHGYVHGVRHENIKGVQAYIDATRQGLPRLSEEAVSEAEAMEDFMMVGLRLLEGVDRRAFAAQFGADKHLDTLFAKPLENLLLKKLIVATEYGYQLSELGVTLGNVAFGEFVGHLA
jgi:oxygen-independent coproporphyrinogen-3 oxidase